MPECSTWTAPARSASSTATPPFLSSRPGSERRDPRAGYQTPKHRGSEETASDPALRAPLEPERNTTMKAQFKRTSAKSFACVALVSACAALQPTAARSAEAFSDDNWIGLGG